MPHTAIVQVVMAQRKKKREKEQDEPIRRLDQTVHDESICVRCLLCTCFLPKPDESERGPQQL